MMRQTTLRTRRIVMFAAFTVAALAAMVVCCDILVARAGVGRIHYSPGSVPPTDVAMVLGTSPRTRDGRANLFFRYRVEAAAELFKSGKVRHLLLSGDNRTQGYDEPTEMLEALTRAGVPREAMTLDYAGFRTLDSVVRARCVFGQSRLVIVSQGFHCERALYIARVRGIDASALVARNPGGAAGLRVRVRESLARVAAVLDVAVLGRDPRFTGPQEPIRLARR